MSDAEASFSSSQRQWLDDQKEYWGGLERVSSPKLEKVLSHIDLKVVSRIANEELAHSRVLKGSPAHDFDFKKVEIKSEDIRFVKGPVSVAIVDSTGDILFSPRKFFAAYKKNRG